MTPLRQDFINDMKISGLSPKTIDCYVDAVVGLARFHGCSPAGMERGHLRSYLVHLVDDRKRSSATIKMKVAAFRKFFTLTVPKPELVSCLKYPNVRNRTPAVMTQDEVFRLVRAASKMKYRAAFLTAYSCGLRVGELTALEVRDIDAQARVVRIRNGKGGKDRMVMLSPKLLLMLREYWRVERPPAPYLFAGRGTMRSSKKAVQNGFRRAVKVAGLRSELTMHSLRHSFATHLLEAGVDVRTIQVVMGHSGLKQTARYMAVRIEHIGRTPSPVDVLDVDLIELLRG